MAGYDFLSHRSTLTDAFLSLFWKLLLGLFAVPPSKVKIKVKLACSYYLLTLLEDDKEICYISELKYCETENCGLSIIMCLTWTKLTEE